MTGRIGVEGGLMASRRSSPMPPWKVMIRSLSRSEPAMAAWTCWTRYRFVSVYSVKMSTRRSFHRASGAPRSGQRCAFTQARRCRTRLSGSYRAWLAMPAISSSSASSGPTSSAGPADAAVAASIWASSSVATSSSGSSARSSSEPSGDTSRDKVSGRTSGTAGGASAFST